ncbi:uncharacterized protein UHOD_11505 [Ustilago sp. UG-2017b]|nr:uncharacterized protein UHOD_11505 [Ustilago sp. UG-2017b]
MYTYAEVITSLYGVCVEWMRIHSTSDDEKAWLYTSLQRRQRHCSCSLSREYCHGSECTGSKKALGSYGRSIGVRDQADPQRSRPWPMDEEMLEKAWSECNLHGECSLHGDHGHGGPGRMHGDPSTATRRTELKEHTDGYHLGARETRVKGTVTGRRRKSSVRDRDQQAGPEEEEQCRRSRHSSGGQEWC